MKWRERKREKYYEWNGRERRRRAGKRKNAINYLKV
jgi:hypothetical protein